MTELPLPPDPTPDELAARGALVDLADELATFLAGNVTMTAEQRRSLNAGTRSLAQVRQLDAEIAAQLSAPTPRPSAPRPSTGHTEAVRPRPRKRRRRR